MSLLINKRLTRGTWNLPALDLKNGTYPWKSRIKILRVINAAGAGQVSFDPAKPANTLTTLNTGDIFELDALGIVASNASTFFTLDNGLPTNSNPPAPTLSSVAPLSITVGDTFNLTGTGLLTAKYVLIGSVWVSPIGGATTSTNVAAVAPPTAPIGSNIPVLVVTAGGFSNVQTLTIASATNPKLATPVINTPVSTTSSSAYFTWSAVPGADGYLFTLNNGTTYPLGNVTSYTATGLTAATDVLGYVVAKDSTGTKQNSNPSATVTATTMGVSATSLTPAHSNYSFNAGVTETLAGAPLPAPYALLGIAVENQPTSVSIPYASSLGDTGYLALLDNTGAMLAQYALADTGGAMTGTVQIALPGSGSARRFRLQMAKRQYNATTYVVNGIAIGQMTFDAGMGSFYKIPPRGIGAWVDADSLYNQAGLDQSNAAQYAPAPTWRRNGVDIILNGGGGFRGYPSIATAADIEVKANLIVAALAPYAIPTYYDGTGPNDYGQGTDPTVLSTARRDLYRRIHSKRPDIRIERQTMLINGYGNNPNSLGNPPHSSQEYRDADDNVIFSTEAYVDKVDGLTLVAYNTDNFESDQLHLTLLGTVRTVGQVYPHFFPTSNVVTVGQYVDETAVNKTGNWLSYTTPDALGGSRIYTNGYVNAAAKSIKALQGELFEGFAIPQVGHHYDVYLTDTTTGIRKKYLVVVDTQTTKPFIVPPSSTIPYILEVDGVAAYGTPANGGQAVWDAWFVRDNVNNLPPTPEILDIYQAGDHVEQDAFLNTSTMNLNNQAGSGGSRIYIDNVNLTTPLGKKFKAATVLFNSGTFELGWKFDVDIIPDDGSATYTATLTYGDAQPGRITNPYASQQCSLQARCVKAYSQGAGTSTGALVLDCVDFS